MSKRSGQYASYCAMVLVLLVLLPGCAGGDSQAILDLVPLQVQLATRYGGSKIVVELQNGNTLGVTVAGSLSDRLDRDRGVEHARKVAASVCQHYASMDRIDQVWVAFQGHQDGFPAIVTASTVFTFEKGDLGCGG